MNIYWWSNAPFMPTGYGNQTALFAPRLKDGLGHDLTLGVNVGLTGAPLKGEDGWMFPTGIEIYGNDVLAEDAAFLKADIVITLYDAWAFDESVTRQFKWCPWLPVDHDPVPPALVKALRTAYQPIAYSRWGQVKLLEAGYDALYVPHGVDTEVFAPMDRQEAREMIGGCPADVFLVGIVAANNGRPSRKAFDQQIRAFAALHKRHPDTMLYIHTDWLGPSMGEPIDQIVKLAGIDPKAVAKPNQYRYQRGMIGTDQMVALYNSFDVLLNATCGEGFGVPILEAQACGTPVIVTDFSAMPELCFAGWKVGVSDKHFTSQWSYQVTPSVGEISQALEQAYLMSSDRRATMRIKAREGATLYDADTVTDEYWRPALERIEAMLDGTARQRVSVNGVDLDVRPGTWDKLIAGAVQQEYCPDLIDYSKVKRAVDVGAHIGAWSLFVKSQSPEAKIVAIEALPANAEMLRHNCNGKNAADITVLEGMCVETPGEYEWLIDPANSGGNTLVKKGERPTLHGAVAQIVKPFEGEQYDLLDALKILYQEDSVADFDNDPADILKLDCEGGEFDILRTITSLTAFRWIVGEYHSDLGNIGDALARLVALGFKVRRLQPTSANLGIFCLERIEVTYDAVSQPANA